MLLEGKPLAIKIGEEIKRSVAEIKARYGVVPKLATLLVREDHGAVFYAKSQQKTARNLGIAYELIHLSANATQAEVEQKLRALNSEASITGMILQMPFPGHLEIDRLISQLDPRKDVEGITPGNLGLLLLGKARLLPCTPHAAMVLIKSTGVPLAGCNGIMIGASSIVGKPMALMLSEQSVTTTLARSAAFKKGTLEADVRRADIVVVAIGKAQAIPGKWIKEGAVVIDIGINDVAGKVVGDVAFEEASKRAAFITPVPGGIGPLTVTLLMQNVVRAFQWQKNDSV